MNPQPISAIIVEDDRSWQQILSEILSDFGLFVDITPSLDGAIRELKSKPHRLAIIDLSLSPDDHNNQDGLLVIDAVRKLDPGCQTILLTGFATVELAVSALTDYNVFTFLRKESFNRNQFKDLINKALATPPQQFSASSDHSSIISRPDLQNAQNGPENGDLPNQGSVLVVEDDAGWRNILAEILAEENIAVKTSNSFGDAMGQLRREKFSVAVVDLSLSNNNFGSRETPSLDSPLEGFQLLSNIKESGAQTIVVSGISSPDEIKRIFSEYSIFAFLEKQLFEKSKFVSLVKEACKLKIQGSELDILTEREKEVLEQISQGLTNKEIAENLFITTNTVKRHLKAIFEKLEVHTRSAAAAKAIGEK